MRFAAIFGTAVLALATNAQAASLFGINVGDDSARTPVTGAAGGANAQNESNQLERCDRTMGTLAVVEDQQARWYYQLREYNLTSTVPLIRLLIQQSNCFVVVERGRAMQNMMQERALQQSGEIREGSNFGKGQIAAADYTLNPMITFSNRDAGGVGGGLGGIARGFFGSAGALVGAAAGSLKFREASTTLMLIDNRSGVQLAAAEGAASKTDFAAWGGVFGGGGGGGAGGYTNTPEGKVLAGAFADAYNQLVKSVKNYKAQEVEGGLGTGGTLGVQGGSTPASRKVGQ
jgi:curli biogenesis system outer membrane secretion channel CsgG